MRILFALLALVACTAAGDVVRPLSAFAVSCSHGTDSRELRAVIIQLDATHAIVGDATETEGVELTPGGVVMGPLKPIPLTELFAMGKEASLKSGIVLDCGPPTIKTGL